MEKLDGIPLGDVWYSMTTKEQHKVMKQIVEWETRLMSLVFPASGSIYYHRDLPSEKKIPLSGQDEVKFCIGPMVHYSWWHGNRHKLDIDRGPCKWTISKRLNNSLADYQQGSHQSTYFGQLVNGS